LGQMQPFSSHDATAKVRVSSILGASVVNKSHGVIGDIEDVVVDPHTGTIAIAILWCGSFLGMAEKLIAIPFDALHYNNARNEYVLDVARDWLNEAPGFDSDHWPSIFDENWNHAVHSIFASSEQSE
jgi:sporulation protein YlmC with PRC-barrel domain